MALEGSLRDFGLADILQLIYFQKKTGLLTISGRANRVRLSFSEGNIVSVESKKRSEEERIGKILLKKGVIKEENLQAALHEQSATGEKIGDILFRMNLIAVQDLEEIIASQMTETVVHLFSWKEGTYEFHLQPVITGKGVTVTLDTQHLLMEGLRIIDEWSLMEGKITLGTVFRKTGKTDFDAAPEDRAVLEYVDGENDVSLIIDLCGINDFLASRTLVSLMERGIIEPVQTAPVVTEIVAAPAAAAVRWEKPLVRFLSPLVFLTVIAFSLMTSVIQESSSQKGISVLLGGESFNIFRTARDIDKLRFMADVYRYKNGSYPLYLKDIGGVKDAWGRPYAYSVENDTLTILSAGPDGKVGTEDDIY